MCRPGRCRSATHGSSGNDGRTLDGRGTGIIEAASQNARCRSGGEVSVCAATNATAVVRFSIGGMLRFISHAETLRLFQRACARAHIPVKFTEGFNPHPKVSLPLPRPVGVASDDELLVLRIFDERGIPSDRSEVAAREQWQDRMKRSLAAVLPQEIQLRSVALMKSNASFCAESVDYVFAVRPGDGGGRLQDKIGRLLAGESAIVERVSPRHRQGRRIDVRSFLESIRTEGNRVVVACAIRAGGSIRVDEIMQLLELAPADLAGPVQRTNVTWKTA
jgi:radical SAM-linked protein